MKFYILLAFVACCYASEERVKRDGIASPFTTVTKQIHPTGVSTATRTYGSSVLGSPVAPGIIGSPGLPLSPVGAAAPIISASPLRPGPIVSSYRAYSTVGGIYAPRYVRKFVASPLLLPGPIPLRLPAVPLVRRVPIIRYVARYAPRHVTTVFSYPIVRRPIAVTSIVRPVGGVLLHRPYTVRYAAKAPLLRLPLFNTW